MVADVVRVALPTGTLTLSVLPGIVPLQFDKSAATVEFAVASFHNTSRHGGGEAEAENSQTYRHCSCGPNGRGQLGCAAREGFKQHS